MAVALDEPLTAAGSAAATTQLPLAVAGDMQAGDVLLACGAATTAPGNGGLTFADSQSNLYTSILAATNQAGTITLQGTTIANALSPGTDTVDLNTAVSSYLAGSGGAFTGLAPGALSSAYGLASSMAQTASATTISITSSATIKAGDLVVVAFGMANGTTFSFPAGWNNTGEGRTALQVGAILGWQPAPSTGTVSCTVTFSTSATGLPRSIAIVAFPAGAANVRQVAMAVNRNKVLSLV